MADNDPISNAPLGDADGATKPKAAAASAGPTAGALPKKTKRQVRKLSKQLGAARAAEARRLRQSAKAHQKVDKRERQAARAAADVAAIEGRIREVTAVPPETKPAPVTSPMPPKPERPARRTAAPAQDRKPVPVRKATPTPKPKPPATA